MNRPTRSQQPLLSFIESFIKQHGYGPSYREVMRALDYKSVSTVAIHINQLIAKGHLSKQGRSARSLEVVKNSAGEQKIETKSSQHEVWLSEKIEAYAASQSVDKAVLSDMVKVFAALEIPHAQAKVESFIA